MEIRRFIRRIKEADFDIETIEYPLVKGGILEGIVSYTKEGFTFLSPEERLKFKIKIKELKNDKDTRYEVEYDNVTPNHLDWAGLDGHEFATDFAHKIFGCGIYIKGRYCSEGPLVKYNENKFTVIYPKNPFEVA